MIAVFESWKGSVRLPKAPAGVSKVLVAVAREFATQELLLSWGEEKLARDSQTAPIAAVRVRASRRSSAKAQICIKRLSATRNRTEGRCHKNEIKLTSLALIFGAMRVNGKIFLAMH